MKLRKEFIIPLAVLVFAVLGLEITGVTLGIGTATFHDTLSSKLTLNKGLNVNGVLSVNGSAITGGSVITASDEGSEIEDDMTGINFAGNLFTATTSSGAVTLTANLDTTKIATLNRSNTFTNTNTFNGQTYTGAIETGNTTVTGTFDVTTGVATFGAAINLIDNTKVITASGGDILYKVTTGGAHIMETQSGTDLMKADSTSGAQVRVAGMESIWGGTSLLAYKLIRGVAPTGNSTVTFAHGLTDGKILNANIWLRHDTTYTTAYHTARNWYVHPNSTYDATLTYYAGFDSLYCWARFPATATATRGDSLYFFLTYIK